MSGPSHITFPDGLPHYQPNSNCVLKFTTQNSQKNIVISFDYFEVIPNPLLCPFFLQVNYFQFFFSCPYSSVTWITWCLKTATAE